MNVKTATPVEIDTRLADLMGKRARVQSLMDGREQSIRWEKERAEKFGREPIGLGRHEEELDELRVQEADLNNAIFGLTAEFQARGGWNRAFLVTNNGGHVHRSMDCSTCRPTTQFHWIVEYADKDESEIVEAAGERACTVCYPTAPVEVLSRPTRIFSEDEKARQAAREEREAKKAERDAAKITLTLWNETVTEKVVNPETGRYSWQREVVLTEVTWKTTRALQNDTGALIRNIYGSWAIINGFEYRHLTEEQAHFNLERMLYALDERGVNIDEFQAKQIKRAEKEG